MHVSVGRLALASQAAPARLKQILTARRNYTEADGRAGRIP
jgi:hypothetical protein